MGRQCMAHEIPIEDHIDLHAFAPRDIKSVVEEYSTPRMRPDSVK
jgi:hypothetical protein